MSDYRLEVNYLRKEELQYELKIRGVDIKDQRVQNMKSQLRFLLHFEQTDKTLLYPKYDLAPDDELTIVQDKAKKLSGMTDALSGSSNPMTCKRVLTRLVHALKRADRIPTTGITTQQVTLRSTTFAKILEMMSRLHAKSIPKQDVDSSILLMSPRSSHVSQLQSSAESSDGDDDDRAAGFSSAAFNSSKSRSVPVMKWNIKFTGEAKGLSVRTFLERVKELRIARNISEVDLFDQALDLFGGSALLWYRANRSLVTNWSELSALLIRHYEPPDYRSRLLQEIMSRKQHLSGSIVDYLSCMTAMFDRYGLFAKICPRFM